MVQLHDVTHVFIISNYVIYKFITCSTSCILLLLNSCWFVLFMSQLIKHSGSDEASWALALIIQSQLFQCCINFGLCSLALCVPLIGFCCASLWLHASPVGRVSGVRFWEPVPSRRRGGASPCLLHAIRTQWGTHAGKHQVLPYTIRSFYVRHIIWVDCVMEILDGA